MSTATHSYVAAATVGIQPPSYRLPDEIHVGRVTLAVSDLERSLSFYQDVIGLAPINVGSEVAELGVDGKVLLELRQLSGILPLAPRSRLGLYHAAFLLPDRGALGSFVNHLHSMRVRYGSSDHFFSEALYLVDPDGLNIEVYADRPRNMWRVEGNELIGGGVQLDLAELSAASSGPWSGAPIHRVDQRLATLTEEQLQQQVAPGRNRLFYLVGHLTAYHDQTLPLLGLGEPLYPNLVNAYITNPDRLLPDPLSATDLKKAWHEVNTALTSGVEKFTESDWVQPHRAVTLEDFIKTPTRNRLAVFLNRTNHVSFHSGQAVLVN